jgi:hypothetical protein
MSYTSDNTYQAGHEAGISESIAYLRGAVQNAQAEGRAEAEGMATALKLLTEYQNIINNMQDD